MENWKQWRKETAKDLMNIEDHEERRKTLSEIKENSLEYKESLDEREDLDRVIQTISARLIYRRGIKDDLSKKQFNDIKQNHYPRFIIHLKKELQDMIKDGEYFLHLDSFVRLKNEFPEIKEFLDSSDIKEKVIESSGVGLEKLNNSNFEPDLLKKILKIKSVLSEIEGAEVFKEKYYPKLIKDIEDRILEYISIPLNLINNFSSFVQAVEEFPELKVFIQSKEIKELADNVAREALNRCMIEEMIEICEYFNLSPSTYEMTEDKAVYILHTLYLQKDFEEADTIMKIFPESRDYFMESYSLPALVSTYLEEGLYIEASEICSIFKIPKQKVLKEVKSTFKKFLVYTSEELQQDIGLEEMEIEEKGGTVSMALDILSNFDWEDKDLRPFFTEALKIILKSNDLDSVEKVIDYFKGRVDVDEIRQKGNLDCTTWLINTSLSSDLILTRKIFTSLKIKREEAKTAFESPDISFDNKFILNLLVHPSLDGDMDKCYQLFGLNTSEDIYKKITDLLHGNDIAQEFISLGVDKTGNEGFEQLRVIFNKIKNSWLSEDPNIEAIKSSELVQKFFKNYVDYKIENEDADEDEDGDDEEYYGYGAHDQESFDGMLQVYEDQKNQIEPLRSYMVPSEVLEIDCIDRKSKIEWSTQFYSAYHKILDSVKESSKLIDEEKKPLSKIASEIQTEYLRIVDVLKERVNHIQKDEAKIGMEKRIEVLEGIKIRSLEDFQKNFTALAKFRELHPFLRKIIFTFSLLKNSGQKERMSKLYGKSPDLDSVTTVLDFVDHITNQETMNEYFTDRQSQDAFKEIAGTKALQEELLRAGNRKILGKTSMQFVPVRNILTEFSGHIADACWASKYESVLRDFPNFTSIIFIKDPDGTEEKLTGACLVIETESADGEKLLVIRGLNPTQSIINKLSIPDFFDKFTEYVKGIAETDNRRVVLVVDDHSGGACTNRPNLFAYISELDLPNVPLKSSKETEFNGYDIVDDCVAVN